MPIVSSRTELGHLQKDGRRLVREVHTDQLGVEHVREYGPVDTQQVDVNAVATARAARLTAILKEMELQACLDNDRVTTVHITKTELAEWIRRVYRSAEPHVVVRIARWIRRRIATGDFTENQVRNAFGLTVPQWDALKVKLQAMDDALATVEEARGE